MSEASPPLLLERGELCHLPPLLMFQGGADPRLPENTAMRMASLYSAAGGSATAYLYEAAGHALSEWPAAYLDEVVARIQRFVTAQANTQRGRHCAQSEAGQSCFA